MRRKTGLRRKGFTLIEILIVITIIGVLTTITIYAFNSGRSKSRDQQRITDLHTIGGALQQYYLDKKQYPATSGNSIFNAKYQLDSPSCGHSAGSLVPSYIGSIPSDPTDKTNSGCSDGANKYLYTTIIPTVGTPAQNFALTAALENTTSTEWSSNCVQPSSVELGIYKNYIAPSITSSGANCVTGPKLGQ